MRSVKRAVFSPGGKDGRCSSEPGRDFEAIWNIFTDVAHTSMEESPRGVCRDPSSPKRKGRRCQKRAAVQVLSGTPWLHADCRRLLQLWDGLVAVWRRAGLTKQGKAAEEMKAVQTQRVRNKTSPCGKGHAWKIFGLCTPGLDVCSPRRGHGKPSLLRTDLVPSVGTQNQRFGP